MNRCEELGVCQGTGCPNCKPRDPSPEAAQPAGTHARSPMAYLRAFFRLLGRVVAVVAVMLVVYCAYWWQEIWIDAQAKHAQAMLDAAEHGCKPEADRGE